MVEQIGKALWVLYRMPRMAKWYRYHLKFECFGLRLL
jgi:hypothetical protein